MTALERLGHELLASAAGRANDQEIHRKACYLLGGGAAKRQPDLTQVMFIMSGGGVEFIPQRAHAIYTMHELKVATPLIVHAGIIDDCAANRFVDMPGDIERHLRIIESLRPGILIHHP
ncbi:MAG TPA: hypothetical protein VN908_04940 [Gemmatimonadales bacterium]|nr:hypothetical protein [Gemmatimonadales bacterium]